jgi:radical SAM family uncharacterized protein/radical SAM-linked protein
MQAPEHPWSTWIDRVQQPARYLGGEYRAIVRHDGVTCRFCMCFPDVYEIGMSHLGTRILYRIVHQSPDLAMERCFTPQADLEQELRARKTPLLSLETWRPLHAFDVVGFSLQFEMTFTNVLTMLELGGIPLRSADRDEHHPLVLAGGPTATHPEPMAPFFDAILVGDAEERLPELLRCWAETRDLGLPRRERLIRLAELGGIYVPALYATRVDAVSGFEVVDVPVDPRVPARVTRAFVEDISRYRFPTDSPVPVAEAVFDRMAVEIARGCTEGCRFCQAGMIYRPVRERDPQEVIDTVLEALDTGGFDEAAITSLSTADYSCISPLIEKLTAALRDRGAKLSVSSLRAYGLPNDVLDNIAAVGAGGLTFAPEAGSQRMRDVINKNISEADVFDTCHRVFKRGYRRIKLYFMIGLPTETDEDVVAIARMGRQALEIGREYARDIQVTVSVSCHVPKPHTPFQWVAMASMEDVQRRQHILKDLSKLWGYRFRWQDLRSAEVEGLLSRGDRRVADVIEDAWRAGARFDSWDEQLRHDVWMQALAAWEERTGLDRSQFYGTQRVDGALPWDHLDVGLAPGFLRREYQRALADRLSPPCGKPVGAQLHHTNLRDAVADERRLVCYHCGVACDMQGMRDERLAFLEKLGADIPPDERKARAAEAALPSSEEGTVVDGDPMPVTAAGATTASPSGSGAHAPGTRAIPRSEARRLRLCFTKLGPLAVQGHLDLVRMVPQILRRAGVQVRHSGGASPAPQLVFGPALTSGARSLAEYVDVEVLQSPDATEVIERVNRVAPMGFLVRSATWLGAEDATIARTIASIDLVVPVACAEAPSSDSAPGSVEDLFRAAVERAQALKEQPAYSVTIVRKGTERQRPLWDVVQAPEVRAEGPSPLTGPVVWMRLRADQEGSLKPTEVAALVLGRPIAGNEVVRVECWARDASGGCVDPVSAVAV